MNPKTAIITGITGQDGSYLAEHLLEKGYTVHGIVRRASTSNLDRIKNIPNLVLHYGDLIEGIDNIIEEVRPSVIYNLAAQSDVWISFKNPVLTTEINYNGFLRILEAVRRIDKDIRVYQASSSEMYGTTPSPQNETSIFCPQSPYGISKLASYWAGVNYRNSYGMFVSNGILYNHESPRRGTNFVTRKIVKAASRIYRGFQKDLSLGNLHALRDWGHAKDYVRAMVMMMEADKPDDFVVATGEMHTVEEFAKIAFVYFDMDYTRHVVIDEALKRPSEVPELRGDSSKIRNILGWEPQYTFTALVNEMCAEALQETAYDGRN